MSIIEMKTAKITEKGQIEGSPLRACRMAIRTSVLFIGNFSSTGEITSKILYKSFLCCMVGLC